VIINLHCTVCIVENLVLAGISLEICIGDPENDIYIKTPIIKVYILCLYLVHQCSVMLSIHNNNKTLY
jgi:hypothetical protein